MNWKQVVADLGGIIAVGGVNNGRENSKIIWFSTSHG